MAQFYFLSILLNIIAGLILVYGVNLADREDSPDEIEDDGSSFKKSINDFGINSASFRLIVGVLCVFTAIMKILSVFRNDIPVVGDLVPALAGFLAAASILLEYFVSSASEDGVVSDQAQKFFIDSRKYIGYFCFVAAVLHFIFPQVILL